MFTNLQRMAYYHAITAEPELLDIGWDILETVKFIKLAQYLKPYIASTVKLANSHEAPQLLPQLKSLNYIVSRCINLKMH